MKSEIFTIPDGNYSEELIGDIAESIKQNKIVIIPSDTIYGFLAKTGNEEKLREIKKRDDKPFLFLISNLKQLEELNVDYKKHLNILNRYWPGKITFIMENDSKKTVGIRFPEWDVLLRILNIVNRPLLSTSVNYSGMESINNVDEIIKEFDSKADLIIVDRGFKEGKASTIVDLTVNPFKIIRKGSVDFMETLL
jgi:L-threonylcarbamoyladenylate synthase